MAESDEQSDQVVVVDVDKHLETASDLERQIIRQVEVNSRHVVNKRCITPYRACVV